MRRDGRILYWPDRRGPGYVVAPEAIQEILRKKQETEPWVFGIIVAFGVSLPPLWLGGTFYVVGNSGGLLDDMGFSIFIASACLILLPPFFSVALAASLWKRRAIRKFLGESALETVAGPRPSVRIRFYRPSSLLRGRRFLVVPPLLFVLGFGLIHHGLISGIVDPINAALLAAMGYGCLMIAFFAVGAELFGSTDQDPEGRQGIGNRLPPRLGAVTEWALSGWRVLVLPVLIAWAMVRAAEITSARELAERYTAAAFPATTPETAVVLKWGETPGICPSPRLSQKHRTYLRRAFDHLENIANRHPWARMGPCAVELASEDDARSPGPVFRADYSEVDGRLYRVRTRFNSRWFSFRRSSHRPYYEWQATAAAMAILGLPNPDDLNLRFRDGAGRRIPIADVLVALHTDPRIRPGMSRAEAGKTACLVAGEIVAAPSFADWLANGAD